MEVILSPGRPINIEVFAYVLSVVGTLGDQISTMIGLTKEGIYESNPFVRQLISNGLWLPLDLAVVILGIGIPFLLIRSFRHPSLKGLIAYPLVFGLVRLGACVWNLSLII
ncbi:hypothetical protein KEJ47_06375 [Candidatus Bathyarchaeota archaeon]|nr:hypothetical protein [Candidatus Bathyarchaeota archaeon]